MGSKSAIEWTDATWNPTTGCTKISSGCKFCYAERVAENLQSRGIRNYHNGFDLTLHEHMLKVPLSWKKPRRVFVNSMSDLFHEQIPIQFIQKVFDVMRQTHQHTYQILTKRDKRLMSLSPALPWYENVWMGVSVENDGVRDRIDRLRSTPAKVKFLSLEPLIGPLPNLDLTDIDWVIAGGESGESPRHCEPNWVRDIRDQCVEAEVPFFFKQWGGINKKKNGRELDGRTWDEYPDDPADEQQTQFFLD